MAGSDHKNPLGTVGHALARNVRGIREAQRLTYAELAKVLAEAGRPIAVLGLRRIERGERRVDADDLLALTVALGVHPVDLLVPAEMEDGAPYAVTSTATTTADRARRWIGGTAFLVEPADGAELADALRPLPPRRAALLNAAWWEARRPADAKRDARRPRLVGGGAS